MVESRLSFGEYRMSEATMLKSALVPLAITLGMIGCSLASDDDDDSAGGTSGANGNGSGNVIDVGTGTNSGISGQNGGKVTLTPEQVTGIRGSSCAGWSTEGEQLPAILELVVDVSGSMD